MSSSKFRLLCLVLPDDDPDAHTFRVEIDNDEIVATLKRIIKDECAPNLAHVPAHELVLWKCAGLPKDDLKQTLKTIQFDGSDVRLVILNPAREQISQFFVYEDLAKEPIHILVRVPAFGECDTRIFCSMLKCVSWNESDEYPKHAGLGTKKRSLEVEDIATKRQKFIEGEDQIHLIPH